MTGSLSVTQVPAHVLPSGMYSARSRTMRVTAERGSTSEFASMNGSPLIAGRGVLAQVPPVLATATVPPVGAVRSIFTTAALLLAELPA